MAPSPWGASTGVAAVRPLRVAAAMVAATAVLVGAAGCDQAKQVVDQAAGAAQQAADSATADAATAAISTATSAALAKADISLVAPPDCTSDLTVNGASVTAEGKVTCVARTTEAKAVRAEYNGTLSPTSCTGSLVISVQEREPISVPSIDGCRIARIVGGAGEGSQP